MTWAATLSRGPRGRTLARVAVGWLALAVSVAAYLVVSEFPRQPFHVGMRDLRFFDLRVYRGAGSRMLNQGRLYAHPIIKHLGFTYPPAAALLLVPLALAPLRTDQYVVTALNVLALVWILNSTLIFARVSRRDNARRWGLAALLAAAFLWLEPVTTAVGYGQIDLLIAGLVMFDLSRSEGARFTGIAIGIAAGIKLTPLFFIVYLFLSGRRKVAARAIGAFLATVLISFIVAGRASVKYWGHLVLDSSRVGGAADTANQSLRGALSRLTHTPHPGLETDLVVAVVAVMGLFLAVSAARRGEVRLGYALAAITTLLISPVSWTHHWCLAIPGLVLLTVTAIQKRSKLMAGLATSLAALGYAYVPERFMGKRHHYLIYGWQSIPADPYVLIGLAVLAVAAANEFRIRQVRRRTPIQAPPVPA